MTFPPDAGTASPAHCHDALPPGARLDEFEVIRVLGAGGFGIVYLALDQVLLRYVAIKEYMPSALAGRGEGAQVVCRPGAQADRFAMGLESFIAEARLLASFDHPSLVKVHRFWPANGTAYMVMQYYPGQTLKDARRELAGPPDDRWLAGFVDPLLGALEQLHAQGVYHRDIAPDNILLLPDGQPVLLDFGSARRVIGDQTQSLTAILKPNFAPVEQYADDAGMRQGAYTDLYALGATVYFMITGQAPPPAVMRAVRDTMPLVAGLDPVRHPGLSPSFCAAIDWTLALSPTERPPTVAALRGAFAGSVAPPPPTLRHTAPTTLADVAFDPSSGCLEKTELIERPGCTAARDAPDCVGGVAGAGAHADMDAHADADADADATSPPPPPPPARPQSPSPRAAARRGWLPALAAGLCALGVGAWALASRLPATAPTASGATLVAAAPAPGTAPGAATAAALDTAGLPRTPSASIMPSTPTALALSTAPSAATPAASAGPAARPETKKSALAAATPRPTRIAPVAAGASPADAASPRPAQPAAPVLAPGTSPSAAEPAARLCADLGFFAAAACLSRSCGAPGLSNHPQCAEARRIDEQRQNRMDQ